MRSLHQIRKSSTQISFANLLNFTVERTYPLQEVAEIVNGPEFYAAEDKDAKFFTEAFLYNLLGKDDARALLFRIRMLGETLGWLRTELP